MNHKELLAKMEECSRLHHTDCYNKPKFKWEWCKIDTCGIWAFGGLDQSKNPHFIDAAWRVPVKYDHQIEGWYCYIGPEPEFGETNEV